MSSRALHCQGRCILEGRRRAKRALRRGGLVSRALRQGSDASLRAGIALRGRSVEGASERRALLTRRQRVVESGRHAKGV